MQKGVSWPSPRFTEGTGAEADCVTDNLTGLMWAKNANLPNGTRTWQEALDYVASINSGSGLCGHNDWRLPNVNELESLVHAGQSNPATWINAQGFTNVQSSAYWSSSTSAHDTTSAWVVFMNNGALGANFKTSTPRYVWPVRAGQSNDADPTYPANIPKTGQLLATIEREPKLTGEVPCKSR